MGEIRSEAMQKAIETREESYKSGAVQYIDSREVAEIVEKQHKNLLADINKYVKELTKLNFQLSDFFIESSYNVEGQSRKYPCYLVTRKGCEFIAHKLTGEKGTKFTATYINRFHEMEDEIAQELVAKQLQDLTQFMEKQIQFDQEVIRRFNNIQTRQNKNFTVDSITDCVKGESESVKRIKILNNLVTKMAKACGWEKRFAFHRLYKTLEKVLDISLDDYLEIHQVRTGDINISTLEMLVEYNRLYETAIRLCENTINNMKCS